MDATLQKIAQYQLEKEKNQPVPACSDQFPFVPLRTLYGRFLEQREKEEKIARSRVYQTQGRQAEEKGNREEALAVYTLGLQLCPDNLDLLVDRADLYTELEDYDACLVDSTRVISIDGTDYRGWYYKGVCHYKLGELDLARLCLIMSNTLMPDPGVLQLLAEVEVKMNLPELSRMRTMTRIVNRVGENLGRSESTVEEADLGGNLSQNLAKIEDVIKFDDAFLSKFDRIGKNETLMEIGGKILANDDLMKILSSDAVLQTGKTILENEQSFNLLLKLLRE